MIQALAKTTVDQPVPAAVVLATGDNGDHRNGGVQPFRVGGLPLVERTILTLRAAGIRRFAVVVDDDPDTLQTSLRRLPSLRSADVRVIRWDPAELPGTAGPLCAGVREMDGPFLVATADQVMDVATVREFLDAARNAPGRSQLATDPAPEPATIDEAHRVATDSDGRVTALGRELKGFDRVAMGLGYFPAAAADEIRRHYQAGATDAEELAARWTGDGDVWTVSMGSPTWQPAVTPADAQRAERRLLAAANRREEHRLKRYLLRPLSRRLSVLLSQLRISPMYVAGLGVITAGGAAYAAANPDYLWLMAGIGLFLLSSVLAASAEEMDRLMLREDQRGWVHRLGDNLRFGSFYAALGVGAYRYYGGPLYLWAVPAFVLVYAFAALAVLGYLRRQPDALQLLRETNRRQDAAEGGTLGLISRILFGWLEKERHVFVAVALCLFGLPHVMFWLACFGLAVETFRIGRTILQNQLAATEQKAGYAHVILYLLGAGVLAGLIWRMPVGDVLTALQDVGVAVIWVFAAAPVAMFADTISLSNLVRHRVGLGELFYTWVVGESYNAIVPLIGLAGEPVKAREMVRWLPVEEASKAVVRGKLIHMLSGPVYTAVTGALTIWLVPLDAELKATLTTICILLAVAGIAMIVVTLSPAPTKFTNFVLRKLKLASVLGDEHLSPKVFSVSLFYKLLGRTLNLIEIYIIFRLLGMHPGVAELVSVSAVVSAVAVIFFMVPQGLGVAELGITGVFTALGYPAHVGLTFGLIRRARFVFWGLTGIGIHLLASVWRTAPNEAELASTRIQNRDL